MKLVYFDDFRLGTVVDDTAVVDVSKVVEDIPHSGPHDLMSGLIERFGVYRERLLEASADGNATPLASVRIRPPLPRPTQIDCMALNYIEQGMRPEPAPINVFLKAPSSVIGDGDTMVLPDVPATIFEAEPELGVVIARRATQVNAASAMEYVFGYTGFIDGSARGLKPEGNTFFQMKSRDTFAPIGPFLVTADEIPDPQNLRIRMWNNNDLMHDFETGAMARSVAQCIEFVSHVHPLEPGDVIATGTDHRGLNPLHDGDELALEIAGIGRLCVHVRDELQRTWNRETRLERHQRGLPGTSPQSGGKYAHPTREEVNSG